MSKVVTSILRRIHWFEKVAPPNEFTPLPEDIYSEFASIIKCTTYPEDVTYISEIIEIRVRKILLAIANRKDNELKNLTREEKRLYNDIKKAIKAWYKSLGLDLIT